MDDLFQHAFEKREKEADAFPLKEVMAVAPDRVAEDFEIWKKKPGANHVLRDLFRMASYYAARYKRTGQRVSAKLLWERERDRIKEVKIRLKKRGMVLAEWRGYVLNNDFTAMISRHITDRRPDWNGMFETRIRKVK